jgi:hypothetical protein
MKFALRVSCFLLLVLVVVPTLPAQDETQSLGELARQERLRKSMKATEPPALTEASFKANILITDSHASIEKWYLCLRRIGRTRDASGSWCWTGRFTFLLS